MRNHDGDDDDDEDVAVDEESSGGDDGGGRFSVNRQKHGIGRLFPDTADFIPASAVLISKPVQDSCAGSTCIHPSPRHGQQSACNTSAIVCGWTRTVRR